MTYYAHTVQILKSQFDLVLYLLTQKSIEVLLGSWSMNVLSIIVCNKINGVNGTKLSDKTNLLQGEGVNVIANLW